MNFNKTNLFWSNYGLAIPLLIFIIYEIKGVSIADWPVLWCIISNIGLLYALIFIIGYYWQNHLFKTILKHPFDLFMLVVLTVYFIFVQIISLFVNGKIPFIHMTF